MFWFVTFQDAKGEDHAMHFHTVEAMFEWLQGYKGTTDNYPRQLCIYKADCVFDGS